jgi:hypothetical protein
MLLGTILAKLDDEADAGTALEALEDIVLLTEVCAVGILHNESPGQYASGAARRFAALASDEDWLALMTALERTEDPARTALERMVRWSLVQDSRPETDMQMASADTSQGHGCSCGGDGSCQPHPSGPTLGSSSTAPELR